MIYCTRSKVQGASAFRACPVTFCLLNSGLSGCKVKHPVQRSCSCHFIILSPINSCLTAYEKIHWYLDWYIRAAAGPSMCKSDVWISVHGSGGKGHINDQGWNTSLIRNILMTLPAAEMISVSQLGHFHTRNSGWTWFKSPDSATGLCAGIVSCSGAMTPWCLVVIIWFSSNQQQIREVACFASN